MPVLSYRKPLDSLPATKSFLTFFAENTGIFYLKIALVAIIASRYASRTFTLQMRFAFYRIEDSLWSQLKKLFSNILTPATF